MKYLKTSEKKSVDNYPYGYKKTTAFFSLEFSPRKGHRFVKQTINPKNGVLNKPKKTTYSPVMLMTENEGKIQYTTFDFYGDAGFKRAFKAFGEHFELFTKEEIKYLAMTSLAYLKGDIQAKVTYCNNDVKKTLPLYEEAIKTLVKIANDGKNLFGEINIDFEAINALKEEGYQPFKVTSYGV